MALTEEQKRRIEEEERFRSKLVSPDSDLFIQNNRAYQKHGLPALLSFFIPGLGQMVKGQVLKGIFVLFMTIFGFALFIIPGFIIWIWQIMDAYNSN